MSSATNRLAGHAGLTSRRKGDLGYFQNEQEVYDTIGKLFEDLRDDAELFPKFQEADTIVRYEFSEPESQITVKMLDGEPGQVDFGPSEMEPEVTMSMSADTAHRFWLGKVNITVALARGQIKAQGPVAKVLKLVPLVEPVFRRYEAQLEEQGRTDLAQVG
jgi:putative sterol carrier protein